MYIVETLGNPDKQTILWENLANCQIVVLSIEQVVYFRQFKPPSSNAKTQSITTNQTL